MKSWKKSLSALVLACSAFALAFTGCEQSTSDSSSTAVTLSSIAVTTQPTKVTYNIGGKLDTTGMVVTATYSDKTTKDVTSSATTSGFDSSAAATDQVVTVSYTENSVTKTATFKVTISSAALSSITITTQPAKVKYNIGDALDTTGMVVTAVYSDETSAPVTGYTTSGFDSSAAATDQVVTVSYTESSVTKTATFTVTISSVTLSSIAITTQPTTTTYYVGGTLDTTGMVVTATYSDGNSAPVTGYTTSGFDSSAAATDQVVTVTYGEKTATFKVTILGVSSIAITTAPTTTEYGIGASLSTTGMVVTATYSDGNSAPVTGYTTSGFDSSAAATGQTVTVTYQGKTTAFTVDIGIFVGLGGENTLDITSVLDGTTEKTALEASSGFMPSVWNAISEYKTVLLKKGSSATYTFTQPTNGSEPYKTWDLAFYDGANNGQFLRGDNWLNANTDAGFSGNLWVAGGVTADGYYSNSYTYLTAASKLDTSATVVVTITYDGTDVVVSETVGGTAAYTTKSKYWKPHTYGSIQVGLGGENTFKLSKVMLDSTEQTSVEEASGFKPSAWNAISEFKTVTVPKDSTVTYTFTQPTQGSDAWNSWAIAVYDGTAVSTSSGQLMRADNWLTDSSDSGFSDGIWCHGAVTAGGTYSNNYDYLTAGKTLPTDATIDVSVAYDGTDVTITEYVTPSGGTKTLAYTATSSAW